ncbi:hypothetical protein QPK31_19240 [Massilia sp. YIM B02769]|uniref:hypothetical protein n=1 Tax=Massilia sp. YIM B02769 TaxID=3050129 RepID=UPI0025B6E532|nr:hypothetical protein [Massilia sp. YIM B02769]MDN4060347.1 hypothetical protein [Massilia sp. YIM B02769]
MIHFVRTDEHGWVRGYFPVPDLDDPDLGPTGYLLPCPPGFKYELVNAPFSWTPPAPAHDARRLANGDIEWVDLLQMDARRAEAIDAIDAAGEALRLAVISKMTQTPEYVRAEQHAREYRAAGYPEGDDAYVPPGVASWAMAKWRAGWTARQAADDILATADRWYALLDEIRALRLANKEDVRHASTADEIAAIVADMEADMQALALQMNTTTTE